MLIALQRHARASVLKPRPPSISIFSPSSLFIHQRPTQHHVQYSTRIHSSTSSTLLTTFHVHNFIFNPKCLLKPQQRRSPPPRHLPPRPRPRRRKLERRPRPLERRRSAPRRARRPTPHTSTKVRSGFTSQVASIYDHDRVNIIAMPHLADSTLNGPRLAH